MKPLFLENLKMESKLVFGFFCLPKKPHLRKKITYEIFAYLFWRHQKSSFCKRNSLLCQIKKKKKQRFIRCQLRDPQSSEVLKLNRTFSYNDEKTITVTRMVITPTRNDICLDKNEAFTILFV